MLDPNLPVPLPCGNIPSACEHTTWPSTVPLMGAASRVQNIWKRKNLQGLLQGTNVYNAIGLLWVCAGPVGLEPRMRWFLI